MADNFWNAAGSGYERVSAWADLLDEINVYPVADGDTGRNLIVSLAPLRNFKDSKTTIRALMLSARGNSGNIAARFFFGFLSASGIEDLPQAAGLGRDLAWGAVSNPKKGTMLTIFDALADILGRIKTRERSWMGVLDHLEEAVHSTTDLLPKLKQANVVDAGALAMFIFFDGFFNALSAGRHEYRPIMEIFKDKLSVAGSFSEEREEGYCVDMVLKSGARSGEIRKMAESDESAVVMEEGGFVKIHLHTHDREKARDRFGTFGIVKWADDDIGSQVNDFKAGHRSQAVHIMTDAAGSVTRKDARELGITLLDSYIMNGDNCDPETHLEPGKLYELMRSGVRVSTSQASDFERYQHYDYAIARYSKVLYLCVGSIYTGNYRTALEWKKINDPENKMTVLDTGTASGRLGLAAIAAARYSTAASGLKDVLDFAEKAIGKCREYIFLDKLHYLARGGRMSRTGAFFGDMLNVKPIVSPCLTGAARTGMARNLKDQLAFLHAKLEEEIKGSKAIIMLEYTDNYEWVNGYLKDDIAARFPGAEVMVQPLSLTTGVHTGPGTWGAAYLDM